ncbi:MAG: hypothetical protein KatS3mg012_0669 [Gaiellaceae bacterium]|nr:MAG: hypothetical protein KatS3mg012_0669 [Gaiellaceae bacterium]
MDARTVSQAASELASLRRLTLQQALVALGAALAAGPAALLGTSLALALGAGAAFEAILALATSGRRRAIIASLAVCREAYLLPDVQRHGAALTTMKSRRALARSIAAILRGASGSRLGVDLVDRVTWQAPALAALAHALAEPENVVEPTAMAACMQLLTDGRASPLLNPALPRTELERVLRRIHAGISPRRQPDAPAPVSDRPQAA